MTFHARYPGRCADCGERINENDLIAVTDDGAICADPPACQRCWAERDRARDTAVRLEQECAQVKALAAEAKVVEQVEAERDALRARVERIALGGWS